MSPRALRVIRSRKDIACVLVNPLQALHPNAAAPGDSTLVDSSRKAGFDKGAYTRWLRDLRTACDEAGVVLILDEVFLGFRLAPRGAQEYFGVKADLVTYGKTVAGGLPIGVLCGRRDLMERFDARRPANICFARGTFNSHPYVMASMEAFLQRLETPPVQELYRNLEETWNTRAETLNARLQSEGIPVRVANLSTIWTVLYDRPSRYNWMFQFYLRLHGIALSWVGTGRLIFPLACQQADFNEIADRFVRAGSQMKADGWWLSPAPLTNQSIRRRILFEMLRKRLGR
jgi:glutamate-1-semialdehyde 2,1-aminomutase